MRTAPNYGKREKKEKKRREEKNEAEKTLPVELKKKHICLSDSQGVL